MLDAATFSDFAVRLNDFQQYPRELARIAIEQGPAGARDYARGHERAEVRQRLSEDLTKIANVYASRAQRIYTRLEDSIDNTALVTSLFAGLAVILGLAGVGISGAQHHRAAQRDHPCDRRRSRTAASRSMCHLPTGMTKSARCRARSPCSSRRCGAMPISTASCNPKPQERKGRQERVAGEIERFSAEVEATLAELGRIADEMLGASRQLSTAAGDAARQMVRAGDNFAGGVVQRARHCIGGRRAVGIGA